jgi:hypothetical protein
VPTVDPISATKDVLVDWLDPVPGFAHELPDDQDDAMPRKCFVVTGAGGPAAGGFLPIGKQRVDVKSYGATHAEAMDVAVAAHLVLKNLRRTVVGAVLVHGFETSSGYTTLREPDTRWPLVLRTYLGMFDEREVA